MQPSLNRVEVLAGVFEIFSYDTSITRSTGNSEPPFSTGQGNALFPISEKIAMRKHTYR